MHTPDQARELWCPMVRIARHEVTEQRTPDGYGDAFVKHQDHIVGGVNHDALSGNNKRMAADHQPLASCRCIADKCGMWRWAGMTDLDKMELADGTVSSAELLRRPLKGYCGLAGRPGAAA